MFISHSTLAIVIAPDEDPQLYIGLSPGIKTMPLEELSVTKNQIDVQCLFSYQFLITYLI